MIDDVEAISPLLLYQQPTGVSPCIDSSSCRTTWNIAVSCIATIALCIWTAMHPNVLYSNFETSDADAERKTVNVWRKILLTARRTWDNFTYQLPLFITAIIYPEFIFARALRQSLFSQKIAKRQGWTMAQGHFIVMGGFHLYKEGKDGKPCPCFPLNSDMVTRLVTDRKLELPTKEEIRDRSKSNLVLKAITFVQISWFLINCIARSARSLPLTKLDIVTAYYIFIALSTYIVWWDKPQNILHPIRVPQTKAKLKGKDFPYKNFLSKRIPVPTLKIIDQLYFSLIGLPDNVFGLEGLGIIPRFYSGGPCDDSDAISILMAIVIGMVSAGIPCIAWSFGSPELSFAEVVLWRLFSLSFEFIILFAVMCLGISGVMYRKRTVGGLRAVIVFIIGFYMISRVGLLILAFMALRSLPATAYETVHWTNAIPHI